MVLGLRCRALSLDLYGSWERFCDPFFSYRPVWKAPHFVTFDIFQDEEKAKLTHSRLLELCRGVATEHVLHKYNIVDPSIASLTSKPAKLVCRLYEKYGAREPGTAHLPPGTSTNSCKRPTKKLPLLIYGCFENFRLPPFKHVSVLFPVIPKCVWRVKNYSPLSICGSVDLINDDRCLILYICDF